MKFTRRPAVLEVAYRASQDPQRLDIQLDYPNKVHSGMCEAQMRQVVTHLGMGVTGGADFAPGHSSGSLVCGPRERVEPSAKYRWQLDLRGVSPLYMRHIVARMRFAGAPLIADSMVIRGSLALDASPMSVRTPDIDAWMEDDLAWPGLYPEPGFAIEYVDAPKGVKIKLRPKAPPTETVTAAFDHLLAEWMDAAVVMPVSQPMGWTGPRKLTKSKSDLVAALPKFSLLTQPTRDQLVSFLIYFHEKNRSARKSRAELSEKRNTVNVG